MPSSNSLLTIVLSVLALVLCLSVWLQHEDHPSQLHLRALTSTDNWDVQHKNTSRHLNKAMQYKRFAALNHLICEDHDSMQYFYWRLDWHWPHCPYIHSKYEESLGRKVIPGSDIVPIFVIFNDKVTDMKEFLRSLHTNVESSFQVIVIETASRIPEATEFVEWLREHHVPVVFSGHLLKPDSLSALGSIVDRYMAEHPEYPNYVVTDPDMSLHGVRGNVLEVYADILRQEHNSMVVGPSLLIDDIPESAYSLQYEIQGGKNIVEWEVDLIPKTAASYYNETRKQRVFFVSAYIDTTFGMYRRNFPWVRFHNGIRVLAPYAMRHVDWYYSADTGVPIDMIKYTCLKWSKAITHTHIPNCTELLAKHNISEQDPNLLVMDERNTTFDLHRFLHVIQPQTELHVKVGDLPADYRRFSNNKPWGHKNHSNHEEFWVEISPNFRSLLLTERHVILPYLAVPHTTAKAEILSVPWFINRDVPSCSSMFSTSTTTISKEEFMRNYDGKCSKKKQELKKKTDKILPLLPDPIFIAGTTPDESMQESIKNQSYTCVTPSNFTVFQETRAALPLSYMLEKLQTSFTIRELDIGSKGADASLLYSITAQLPFIGRVRCECQRGSWHHSSEIINSCDEIVTFLRQQQFEVDFLQVSNCGLEEYRLQATNKVLHSRK